MKHLALCLLATPALADPSVTVMTNDQGAILEIFAVNDAGFDFSLSSGPCPEGETTCLVVFGTAEVTAKGYRWSEGNSRIFFADTPEGVKILQTAGDLGAGTANRAAKLAFPGDYRPDPEALAQMGASDLGLPVSVSAFQSPTGNIACQFFEAEATEVRCDLGEFTATYRKRPASCEFDWGNAFGVTSWSDVGEVLCHSDTIRDPEAQVLDYGYEMTVGDVTCWSQKTGVTCENAQGHGFQISRRRQEVY